MDRLTITAAAPGDEELLAPRLRAIDRLEAHYVGIRDIQQHLRAAILVGTETWTVRSPDGAVQAIGGVEEDPYNPAVAVVWLMGTDALVRKYRREFIRRLGEWIARLSDRYSVLWNTVDAENHVHIRWLKWAGFTMSSPVQHAGGRPFFIVTRQKEARK